MCNYPLLKEQEDTIPPPPPLMVPNDPPTEAFVVTTHLMRSTSNDSVPPPPQTDPITNGTESSEYMTESINRKSRNPSTNVFISESNDFSNSVVETPVTMVSNKRIILQEVPPPPPPFSVPPPPVERYVFFAKKNENIKQIQMQVLAKESQPTLSSESRKRNVTVSTSLGGGAGARVNHKTPLKSASLPPPSKSFYSFFSCCSKNEIRNQVVDSNRPIDLDKDKSVQLQIPPEDSQLAVQSNFDLGDIIGNLHSHLTTPIYANIFEPVGNMTHDYVVKPTNDYVVQPANQYVVQPANQYVVQPVGNASATYVTGPIYSNVLEPVGTATNNAVLKPVSGAIMQ